MQFQVTGFRRILTAALFATGLLTLACPTSATEQGEQRRAARDTKQDARQGSRTEKADCRQADQKNNAECRQDKRNTKQDARQKGRDVKY